MPNPSPNETKKEFMDRCIPILMKEPETKNVGQACAICYSYWDKAQKQVSESIFIQYINELI